MDRCTDYYKISTEYAHTHAYMYVRFRVVHCFDPLIVCGGQTRANLLRVKFPIDAFRVAKTKTEKYYKRREKRRRRRRWRGKKKKEKRKEENKQINK